jgi:hypothetical protein
MGVTAATARAEPVPAWNPRMETRPTEVTSARNAGIPDLPPIPPGLSRALEPSETRLLFGDTGYRSVERWEPTRMSADELAGAAVLAGHLRLLVEPAARPPLLARVLALLSHYRSEANPPQVEMAIADDWAQDLGEFPMWAIEDAARTWRRTRKFKPQICEIRDLCQAACARHAERLRRVEALIAYNNPSARRAGIIASSCIKRLP